MLIVTDSAVDLPAELQVAASLSIVASSVWLGGRCFTGEPEAFWHAVRTGALPTTKPPTADALVAAYTTEEAVVAIHVSAEFSATVAHARDAEQRVTGPVAVVDSRSLGAGAGLVAETAYRAALQDMAHAQVAAVAETAAAGLRTFALVDDVGWLYRSGRAGLLPSARLSRRHPVLLAARGRAVVLDLPKHRGDGIRQLARHARSVAGDAGCRWALGHGDAADAADAVERIGDALGRAPAFSGLLGSVVGTHLGPSAILVGILPASAVS